MIEIIQPAGFEDFFAAMSDMLASGPPEPEKLLALAERHGLEFGAPPWLADVIERYDLTPPPGPQ